MKFMIAHGLAGLYPHDCGARPVSWFPRDCEAMSLWGVKRPKSCPKQSEGNLEIATGYPLATTNSDYDAASARDLLFYIGE